MGLGGSVAGRARSGVGGREAGGRAPRGETHRGRKLAYPTTEQKGGGSGSRAVILPAAQVPPRLCYRNLFYTGVTRGRKLCIVVGRRDVVNRMMSNIRQNLRYSGLAALLAEALPPGQGKL